MKGGRSFRRSGGHLNLMEEATETADDWGEESWTVDCLCGVNFDDGEEMVNCDECGVWVHTRCSRYVKGEDLFTCDNCKKRKNATFPTSRIQNPINCNNSCEETEVAQFLVELPTKAIKLESSPSSVASARRQFKLWAEIPMEDRVHVQGIPGGDPSLFAGVRSSIFTPALWKCTGYVPKKFSFMYKEFPCWDDDTAADIKDGDKIDGNEIAGNDEAVKDPFKSEVDGSSLRFGMKKERSLLRSAVLRCGKRKKEDSIFDDHHNSRKRIKTADRTMTKRCGSSREVAFASSSGNLDPQVSDDRGPRIAVHDMKNGKKNNSRESGKCSIDSLSDDISAEADKGLSVVNDFSNEDSSGYRRRFKSSDEQIAGVNVTNRYSEATVSSQNAPTLHGHRPGFKLSVKEEEGADPTSRLVEVSLAQSYKNSSSDTKMCKSFSGDSGFPCPNVKKETEESLGALTIEHLKKNEDPAKLVVSEGPSELSFNEPCGSERVNDGAMILEEASSSSFAAYNGTNPSLGKRSGDSSHKHFVSSYNPWYAMDGDKAAKNKSTVRREKPPSNANASSSIGTSTALSDEELALLLHQELNSSPRVPRVRNSCGLPQLRSPSLKRSDHQPLCRRKEEASGRPDANVKVTATCSPEHRRRDDVAYSTANSGPSSSTEVNESSSQDSLRDASDEDASGPIPRTLPVLLEEIMSKGERMTYEELCNAVSPHWNNLRKHNGERYAYSSPSHAVLDCLRHRHEWAQLVDRGPKAKRAESDDDGLWRSKDDIKTLEEYPKRKRNTRKRKMAPQGLLTRTSKSQKSGTVSEDDSCALSDKNLSCDASDGTDPSLCSDDHCT